MSATTHPFLLCQRLKVLARSYDWVPINGCVAVKIIICVFISASSVICGNGSGICACAS